METVIALATYVILASGAIQLHETKQIYMPNEIRALQACWKLADEFVHGNPAALGGVALGAGCVVRSGRPS